MKPSEVAAAAGVNLQTLRYYERRGLLAEPTRTLGGHRQYPAEAITTLRVIKAAQRLGFTLAEVSDLLATATHRHARGEGAGLQARAQEKLHDVEAKIADLTVIAETLRAGIAAGCEDLETCAGDPDCPLPFASIGATATPGEHTGSVPSPAGIGATATPGEHTGSVPSPAGGRP